MKIFIYEYITGGGLWREAPGAPPEGSLLREGAAMVRAIAADFAALGVTQVVALRDSRLDAFELPACHVQQVRSADEERAAVCALSADSDYTLLIAPELDGALLARCGEVEAGGGRLLGPPADFVAVAADKHAAAERLRSAGLPAPEGIAIGEGDRLPRDFPLPAVLKRRDGAGSQQTWRIETVADLAAIDIKRSGNGIGCRLERWAPGLPASAAVLCGPENALVLPACWQRLSHDGRLRYLGGSLSLEASLDARARSLAEAAVRAIGPACGYVGVDLVLGEPADGSEDTVIEVNPRLTTSYIGLRRAARGNLAQALLAVARGETPALSFSPGKVEFTAETGEFP